VAQGQGSFTALLPEGKLHYNSRVPVNLKMRSRGFLWLGVAFAAGFAGAAQQQAPPASSARMLILPRRLISGERATLAVLDVSGRLTPGVHLLFSNGDKVTTDATGRARFVAPLTPGPISATIEGRAGRVSTVILPAGELSSATLGISGVPRVASLSDRLEIVGQGFCGDADANQVKFSGAPGLVLASSPGYLAVLPPLELLPGAARVEVSCGQRSADAFTVVFVTLELEAGAVSLSPGEHRVLTVRVKGSTANIQLEARNLAAEVAELLGGASVRAQSSGGSENVAHFELVGKQRGSFVISIRLVSPPGAPRP
jgi:hypothetical protein